jgi:glucose-6-phosphate 1-dehydrogenase
MDGDPIMFSRQDGVEAAWSIVEPILGNATPVREYEPGSWGPPEAAALASCAGGWHCPPPSVCAEGGEELAAAEREASGGG